MIKDGGRPPEITQCFTGGHLKPRSRTGEQWLNSGSEDGLTEHPLQI